MIYLIFYNYYLFIIIYMLIIYQNGKHQGNYDVLEISFCSEK
jgi:hypothetical protein